MEIEEETIELEVESVNVEGRKPHRSVRIQVADRRLLQINGKTTHLVGDLAYTPDGIRDLARDLMAAADLADQTDGVGEMVYEPVGTRAVLRQA